MSLMTQKQDNMKVLINYTRNGVSVTQSLYTGPHKKQAEKAYQTAVTLARHGVLTNCTIRFFDGFRLRQDWERTSEQLAGELANSVHTGTLAAIFGKDNG